MISLRSHRFTYRIADLLLSLEGKLHRRLFGYLMDIAWPLISDRDRFMRVTVGELELLVDLREGADREVWHGRYHPALQAFMESNLSAGDVFMDVGANIGQISVIAANLVGHRGQVLALEPNPALVRRLRVLATTNPRQNLEVLATAAGETSGVAELIVSSSHPYSTLEPAELPGYPVEGKVAVSVRTVDQIIEERGLARVRVLKIDAQGYENRVILGARRSIEANKIDSVVIEASPSGFEEVRAILEVAGLRPCARSGSGLEPLGERDVRWGEDLFFLGPSITA